MRATKNTWNELLELNSLRELSRRLGSDRLLVQASSGNTSMKIDDTLWIKASGKWLVDAEAADFLIPVQLARAKKCLDAQMVIPETKSSGGFSASIETAMHAVLPHKVIVHVHSVNAIAWAVREDAPTQLSHRLSGLAWQWLPYTRSGADLARKIGDICLRCPQTNVLILGNHGLVVCGESCDSAKQLLAEVERRLKIDMRPAPECAEIQALATDPISRRILSGGVLYPCQALFLPSTVRLPEDSPLKQLAFFRQRRMPLLIDDHGVFCSSDMTSAEREMLVGFANVVQRIHPSAPIRYLSFSEVLDVLNVDSENYLRVATRSGISKADSLGA
ncbi:MAG TPA: class II aldolase/adducin family protein [Bryobacteraceae bacterium]|jgi:ribulose-5-phosphate 4-epimerase/fuculose-1-phosphate aldolase|nr:class II aldolase/adducin family protein [Bryobacteraceae bacterium]